MGWEIGYDDAWERREPFEPKPDTPEWINHKLTDESWAKWRALATTDSQSNHVTQPEEK
jgi:hypothetical protein